MARSVSKPLRFVLPLALVAVTSGCGANGSGARDEAFAEISSRAAAATSVRYATTLSDFLPPRRLIIDGGEPQPTSDGIVYGEVASAEVGGAWVVDGGRDGSPVALDDPDADWRMVAVQIEVRRSWGSSVPKSGIVTFGLTIYPSTDADTFLRGMREIGSAVVVLRSQGYYEDNPTFYRVEFEGLALGVVEDGRIQFPAMDTEDAAAFIGNLHTLSDIEREATAAQPPIVVQDGRVISK